MRASLNPCPVVWYGMVWYGMVWYGMVWYGMVWYGMVWYGMVWYGMAWYGMVWYGMGRCWLLGIQMSKINVGGCSGLLAGSVLTADGSRLFLSPIFRSFLAATTAKSESTPEPEECAWGLVSWRLWKVSGPSAMMDPCMPTQCSVPAMRM